MFVPSYFIAPLPPTNQISFLELDLEKKAVESNSQISLGFYFQGVLGITRMLHNIIINYTVVLEKHPNQFRWPRVRLSFHEGKKEEIMSQILSREVHLKSRPVGMPTVEEFELVINPLPDPAEREMLVRNIYMSVDPYMRGRMREGKSYAASFQLQRSDDGGMCRPGHCL